MSAGLHTSPRDRLVTAACRLLSKLFDLGYRLAGQPAAGTALTRLQRPRILIIKPCCMGDVVMSTAMVRALRQAFPQAQLTYAVGSWSRSPLAGNPRLDRLIDLGRSGSGSFKLKPYLDLVRRIRSEHFDACFVLDRSPLLALLPWLAGIPIRIGIDSRGRGFALTARAHWEPEEPRHEAELYLDTLRAIGVQPESPRLEIFPSEQEQRRAEALLAEHGLAGYHPLIVIHTGGGVNPGTVLTAKRWSAQNFAALADRLIEQDNARIVFIGGQTDREPTARALQAMRARERAIDLTGQTKTMGELAALYAQADCFVGNDSGTMHLACACDIPVVAIFGPSDPRMYAPYTPKGIALSAGRYQASGRSGYAGRDDESLRPQVSVDEVYQAVHAMLPDTAKAATG